jgi:hypothetical protein
MENSMQTEKIRATAKSSAEPTIPGDVAARAALLIAHMAKR